ncbi:protocatechuate 3,4-dioxygenase subunit alpha [Sphingomonas carotinifaciens]|uniref:Protocatechuate 3,4-dioxygenase subunit alpha n=1 Tax=Sphingomonas carotinifaciens TaxID=1166323 RepID=A0A1G7PSE3_9SPHN|nr:protocatechuate 3,4-dioxygenase subunit alpha [Sphingomonas carotinifaciens]MBB4087456.1 protocatechuate 3,4-dioxygenase alpha subunit [Sphingomonas carotinifaciens]MWC45726.1 protocatechuate 3,4-dioxygenase subunit alpha [Sphingomonas carotinifaciens]SDF88320.1 protocatechuate 3,4-dioxygenase, alpha subunit [Sphingomonas carotinifaciens]
MTIDVADRRPAPRVDNQDPTLFGQTPSQTVGPFFHYGLPWKGGADLVGQSDRGARPELFPEAHYVLNLSAPTGTPAGEVIELTGRVVDGAGAPVPDAMLELWQADAAGRYGGEPDSDPHFVGFGRAATGEDGRYRFRTILPGSIGPGHAPHIALSVFGRGLIKRLATRVYFAGMAAEDAILSLVPAERRATLIATAREEGVWSFDIVLQGERETVFFDL